VREYFEGELNTDSNFISIQENGMISFNVPDDCVPCIKKYQLTYHKGSTNPTVEEQLRGTWTGKAANGKSACDPGSIVMQRFSKSAFKEENLLPPSLTKRKAELVKEITVDTGTIKLDFYDNGQIDGDTISVYVNNKTIVANKLLTAIPISVAIKIDLTKKYQEVIMVGENLGSIPPNTALMIVHAGNKRYQLYLTSDNQKNAMVRFIYKDPSTENAPR
nr:hypothetical protein [Chitinophagaceae bacterium]